MSLKMKQGRLLMQRQKSALRRAEVQPPPATTAPIAENPFIPASKSEAERLAAAGVIVEPAAVWSNRLLNVVSIGVPAIGSLCAFALLPTVAPTLTTLAVFLVFFFVNALGISIGLHRYFTHRAYRPKPWFAVVLAVAGSWAFQGPIARWVADHRRHHRFSDQQFDPHSPYWTDRAETGGRAAGWAHAHLLWMVTGRPSCEARYAKDVRANRLEAWSSDNYWLLAASGLALPAAIGFLIGGAPEAIMCFLWAGCLRVSLLHQITWSVNSFGHMFGTKVDGSRDQSRDNKLLAVMLIGEGLHSYHHKFPLAAINEPAALDASGWTLKMLAKAGVVDLGVKEAAAA